MKVCFNSSSLYNSSLKSIRNNSETNQSNNIQIQNSNINFGNSKKKLGIIGAAIFTGFLGFGSLFLYMDRGQVRNYQKIILEESGPEALSAAKKQAAKIKGFLDTPRKVLYWSNEARLAIMNAEHTKKPPVKLLPTKLF